LLVFGALLVMIILFFAVKAFSMVVINVPVCTDISSVVIKTYEKEQVRKVVSLKVKIKDMSGNDITILARKIYSEFFGVLKRDGWQVVRFEVIEDTGNGTTLKDFKKESICQEPVEEIDRLPTDIQLELSEDIAGEDLTFRDMLIDKDPKSLFNRKVCRECFSSDGLDAEKFIKNRNDFYKASLKIVNDSILGN
jgi:hypothetical protein